MKKIAIIVTAVVSFLGGVITTLAVCENHIDDPIYDACH